MSSPTPTIVSPDDEDTSHIATPIVADHTPMVMRPSSVTVAPSASSSSHSTADSSPTPLSPVSQEPTVNHIRLPIPTPSTNRSQSSFAFADVADDGGGDFDDLPPEVASADISMAREYPSSFSVLQGAFASVFILPCSAARAHLNASCRSLSFLPRVPCRFISCPPILSAYFTRS